MWRKDESSVHASLTFSNLEQGAHTGQIQGYKWRTVYRSVRLKMQHKPGWKDTETSIQ